MWKRLGASASAAALLCGMAPGNALSVLGTVANAYNNYEIGLYVDAAQKHGVYLHRSLLNDISLTGQLGYLRGSTGAAPPAWLAQFDGAPKWSTLCGISASGADQAAAITACLARSDVSTGTPIIMDCAGGSTILVSGASVKFVSGGTYKLLQQCPIDTEFTNGGFTGKFMNTNLSVPIAHLEWYDSSLSIVKGYAAAPGRTLLLYADNFTMTYGSISNANGGIYVLGANQEFGFMSDPGSNPAGGNPGFKSAGNQPIGTSTFAGAPEVPASTVNTDGTLRPLIAADGNPANIYIHDSAISGGDAAFQPAAPIQGNVPGVTWGNTGTTDVLLQNNSRLTVAGQEAEILLIAANISHFKGAEAIAVGGTITPGDQLQATLTAPCAMSGCGASPHQTGIVGSPVTVSYTTVLGDTLASAAVGLAAAINGNSAIGAAGISASASGATTPVAWGGTTGGGFIITWSFNVTGAATETLTGTNDSQFYAVDIAYVEVDGLSGACGYADCFAIRNQYNTAPHHIGFISINNFSMDGSFMGSGPTGTQECGDLSGLDKPGFPSPIDHVSISNMTQVNCLGKGLLVDGDVDVWSVTNSVLNAPRLGTGATIQTFGDSNGSVTNSTIAAGNGFALQIGAIQTPSNPSTNFTLTGSTLSGIDNGKAGVQLGDVDGATIGAAGAGNGNVYLPDVGTSTALGIKMFLEASGNPINARLTFNDVTAMTAAAPIAFVAGTGNCASSNPGSVDYTVCH